MSISSDIIAQVKFKLNNNFSVNTGFEVNSDSIWSGVQVTNKLLTELPVSLFNTIDYKTTSTLIGRFFCDSLASKLEGAIVNPIEKGHPDIIPVAGKNASEAELRNYHIGLEIKCTVGNIKSGANLRAGSQRIDVLTGVTWQAHHQEVTQLLGLIWDFSNNDSGSDSYLYPAITGAFYASNLDVSDWGMISGTTGRNTKVCGMTASGRKKMGEGWILIYNDFFDKYSRLLSLGSNVSDNCRIVDSLNGDL